MMPQLSSVETDSELSEQFLYFQRHHHLSGKISFRSQRELLQTFFCIAHLITVLKVKMSQINMFPLMHLSYVSPKKKINKNYSYCFFVS